MDNGTNGTEFKLICVIVNFGLGSKVISTAKRCGVTGGTIALGKGTVNNRILDFLGLSDIRKEIVYMAAEKETAVYALAELDHEFEFSKPNHGIAFTTSLSSLVGTKRFAGEHMTVRSERGVDDTMFNIITTIVDKGKAEEVIAAATEAGSKGGTIVNARGSGIHETSKLFAMEIEPEKEMVIILSAVDKTAGIVSMIRENLKIDDPGNGIIYIQDTSTTYGILK
ncbi:MAG TPA: transcriptional regulator [Firmicutes bacterium]|jgi:nitrogen regulatory protein PII|nr:transcriptional regulator [Bacillota bacterium]HBL51279.1 transcriptional regulator [Bacillota bacterium]HBR23158.1 transcriptional regulator [Bacillota bacterium]HCF88330.1 transcriptional regulator [Bacillota bacterium]HCM18865.1 transcriptional regulator [Bacillota bacterium]